MNFVLITLLLSLGAAQANESAVFRFAIPSEPHSLDPAETVGYESQHLIGNIFRGLFRIDEEGRLIEEGAEACEWEAPIQLTCRLKKLKYSDGSPITAPDYVRAFLNLLSPKSKTSEMELLANIHNALEYHRGANALPAIQAKGSYEIIFKFDRHDPEFEYKLASPVLFPFKELPNIAKAAETLVNGPYLIRQWDKARILLDPNPHYHGGHPKRPRLEVRFVADETTIINMFDSGRLDFIRRLPTLSIERYRLRTGFMARPLSRFDYLGFGPALKDFPALRAAMTKALDYEEFRKLFDSLSRPGCPSFPDEYSGGPVCYDFNAKIKTPAKPQARLRMVINQSGGEDLRRGAEWFQNQWKKNLGLNINVESIEGKVLLSEIQNNTPDIFRLGVPLSRPTCLAALELFKSESPNNHVHIKDKELDRLILKLEESKGPKERSRNCRRALKRLLDMHALIPLGRFQFFMVLSDKFKGIKVNEINHLDLSQLHPL